MSEERDDGAVNMNRASQSPEKPSIRDLEAEQGYDHSDEEVELVNDAGRDGLVADRTDGVAPEDVVSCLLHKKVTD